jgi:predicted NBD/HSP70 family sugar kinase
VKNNYSEDMSPTGSPKKSKTLGGTPRRARQANLQLVLEALRTHGPSSQRTVSRVTGLPPATINNVVQSLRSEGLADIRWINGREALVTLIAKQGTIVSLQVAPDLVHGALFSFDAGARFEVSLSTPGTNDRNRSRPKMVLEAVRTVAKQAGVEVQQLSGVSIAMQAPIDSASGAIASWASTRFPGWKDVPLRSFFEGQLGVPVSAENDANLGALAEWTWGAGRGTKDFLYIGCSEQIGGGLVLGGHLHRGGNGMAGEIGHMVLDPTGPVCFCGNRGCLSTLASERAVLLALEASHSPKRSLMEVIDGALSGDPACQRVLFEAGRHLGRAAANAAKLLAPSMIAIGGILGRSGPLVFDGLLSSVEVNNLKAVSPSIQFVSGQITEDATLLGGVASMLSQLGPGISELPEWMHKSSPK